jgi:hypothetical protein
MTRLRCEHESDVSRSARTGFWSAGLEQHAETCGVCSETRAVTEALLAESTRIRAARRVPEAARVWLEARRRARLHLRHRAAFWFRALRVHTVIYAVASFSWLLSHHSAPASVHWTPSLRAGFASVLTRPAEAFAVTGALLAALCISMGFWYLLREARQPLQQSPGR